MTAEKSPGSKPNAPEIDSLVIFRNSQGTEGRGTLLHLTRNVAVFEVYNPYSIVQLSEVLSDVRILRGERTVYRGKAVVGNLVSTGMMVIVSATLVDAWEDLAGLVPGEGLREEVELFVEDWESTYSIRPTYQLAVTNIATFLTELSRWLSQAEASGGTLPEGDPELELEFVKEASDPLVPKITELFGEFEEEAAGVEPEESDVHKAFARRELHPVIMRSPFNYRTYTKPLGYAGDYQMVNMILRNEPEGPSIYAKLVNSFTLSMAPAEAHRNRIDLLVDWLAAEAERAAAEKRTLKILNVGCGPAAEVERLIRGNAPTDHCEFELMDFNQETLDYAQGRIEEAVAESGSDVTVDYRHQSIHGLLKEAARRRSDPEPTHDMVYCAGLFDYLSARICERLLALFDSWVRPGGLVLASNVHPDNPIRFYMEYLLEWSLHYRKEADLREIAPENRDCRTLSDETGINVFLQMRKSGNAAND
ncbi:MAG: class I SAM-dependent methyltransferase [Planctomycetota bacterium]